MGAVVSLGRALVNFVIVLLALVGVAALVWWFVFRKPPPACPDGGTTLRGDRCCPCTFSLTVPTPLKADMTPEGDP